MIVIAGLGNPGREYEHTRHNVGFWAADRVADRFKVRFERSAHRSLVTSFSFKGETHLLVKPQTYMNLSGEALREVLQAEGLQPQHLVVILDDIHVPVGRLRLRPSGSDGGHNGMKSIIGYVGEGFWRLRIGVGQPPRPPNAGQDSMVSHVLGPMDAQERTVLDRLLVEVPEIVVLLLLGMGGKAMSRFNGRDFASTEPKEEKGPSPRPKSSAGGGSPPPTGLPPEGAPRGGVCTPHVSTPGEPVAGTPPAGARDGAPPPEGSPRGGESPAGAKDGAPPPEGSPRGGESPAGARDGAPPPEGSPPGGADS